MYPKKIILTLIYILLALVLLTQFSSQYAKSYLQRPTHGPVISTDNLPNSALLVIDIQNAYLTKELLADNPTFISNVNETINYFHQVKGDVIFIKMVKANSLLSFFTPEIAAIDSQESQIVSTINIRQNPAVFTKFRADAFSNQELQQYLIDHHVGRLFITGMVAENCILATVQGAKNRGYEVLVVSDCIVAENGENSKQTMVKTYQKFGSQIITSADLSKHQ